MAKRMKEAEIDRLGREAFIHTYLASARFTSEVEALCREEQLTMSHFTVLWFLSRRHSSEGIPMGALADGHLNRASDVTRLADRLLSLGFLERLASAADRRVVLVRLTEAGRAVFVRLTARIKSLHREQWSHLDADELATLSRLVAKALWGSEAGEVWKHPLIAESDDAGKAAVKATVKPAAKVRGRKRATA